MANLSQITCTNSYVNTGVGECPLDPKYITGVYYCPEGTSLGASSPATLLANLQAAALSASTVTRIMPVYGLVEPKDNSGDVIVQEYSTGQKRVVREPLNDWGFEVNSGFLNQFVKLRQLNGVNLSYYFVDSNNIIYGTTDPNIPGNIRAIPQLGGFQWAAPWKMNDGTKNTAYPIRFVFNASYINEYLFAVPLGVNAPDYIEGLQDVALSTPGANSTPGSFDLQANIVNGDIDMYPEYSTTLASSSLWTCTNTATGASIPITSVTATSSFTTYGGDGWVIAVNVTAPPYPASGTVTFSLASPATLSAAGVLNFVSNTVAISKS